MMRPVPLLLSLGTSSVGCCFSPSDSEDKERPRRRGAVGCSSTSPVPGGLWALSMAGGCGEGLLFGGWGRSWSGLESWACMIGGSCREEGQGGRSREARWCCSRGGWGSRVEGPVGSSRKLQGPSTCISTSTSSSGVSKVSAAALRTLEMPGWTSPWGCRAEEGAAGAVAGPPPAAAYPSRPLEAG